MNPSDSTTDSWIQKQAETKSYVQLSIIVPAYNERWRLPPTLIDIVDYFDKQSFSYEVIVVDDGSTDETSEVVQKFERVRNQVRLIRLPKNCGKGHAVRLGALNASGARIMFADADGATPIEEVERILAAMDAGADIAIGSRAKASTDTKVTTKWYRKFLGRTFKACVNFILLPGIEDTQCGFKMFTRDAARFVFTKQQSDGFSFDVEILYIAQRAKLKIAEVPINWENVPGSKVNLVLDALRMFRDVLRFRVIHRGIEPHSFRP